MKKTRRQQLNTFFLSMLGVLLAGGVPYFLTIPRHDAVLSAIGTTDRLHGIARIVEVFPAVLIALIALGIKLLGMHRTGTKTILDQKEEIGILQDDNRAIRERVEELDKHPPLRATQVVRLVKEGVEAAQKAPPVLSSEIVEHLEHVAKVGPDVLREAVSKFEDFRVLVARVGVVTSALRAHLARSGTPVPVQEEKSIVAQGVVGPPTGTSE